MMATRSKGPCIVCGSSKIHYSFSFKQHRVEECVSCKLMRLNPQPSDETLSSIYGSQHFILSDDAEGGREASDLKAATAQGYLSLIENYVGAPLEGRLLEIGCGHGDFLVQAANRGLDVTGIEYSAHSAQIASSRLGSQGNVIVGEIDVLRDECQTFDFVVFADVVEHVRDPRLFLSSVHALLKDNGLAIGILPTIDSLSARLMGASWMEFKLEHLWYFSTSNLSRLMRSEGFGAIRVVPARKTLSFDYIAGHFDKYPVAPFTGLLKIMRRVMPKFLRKAKFRIAPSGIVMVAQRARKHEVKILSIIMPIYNEVATVRAAIERVLAKQIDNIHIKLIVVESNSTDGSRAIVQSYEGHERVKVILQERPLGKGNAVRAGIEHVDGDIVLIQDADDEYDIDDYDALLEPLLTGEAAFVLGARHGGGAWKMRRFTDQPVTGIIMNLGHRVFATLLNVVYLQRMKDPFTMYKVFRADCLRGIKFECDRYDFDIELVIKLIKNGFTPVEIPVNYRSRSFNEGKKVDVLRDPITWLRAIFRLRFQ